MAPGCRIDSCSRVSVRLEPSREDRLRTIGLRPNEGRAGRNSSFYLCELSAVASRPAPRTGRPLSPVNCRRCPSSPSAVCRSRSWKTAGGKHPPPEGISTVGLSAIIHPTAGRGAGVVPPLAYPGLTADLPLKPMLSRPLSGSGRLVESRFCCGRLFCRCAAATQPVAVGGQ